MRELQLLHPFRFDTSAPCRCVETPAGAPRQGDSAASDQTSDRCQNQEQECPRLQRRNRRRSESSWTWCSFVRKLQEQAFYCAAYKSFDHGRAELGRQCAISSGCRVNPQTLYRTRRWVSSE